MPAVWVHFKLLACSDRMIDHELMEADNYVRQLIVTGMRYVYVCSQLYSTCANSGTNISPTMRDQSFHTMILLHIHACGLGLVLSAARAADNTRQCSSQLSVTPSPSLHALMLHVLRL